MNRSAFQSGTGRDPEKPVLFPTTLFSVAPGDDERNGLCSSQPLIPGMAFRTVQ